MNFVKFIILGLIVFPVSALAAPSYVFNEATSPNRLEVDLDGDDYWCVILLQDETDVTYFSDHYAVGSQPGNNGGFLPQSASSFYYQNQTWFNNEDWVMAFDFDPTTASDCYTTFRTEMVNMTDIDEIETAAYVDYYLYFQATSDEITSVTLDSYDGTAPAEPESTTTTTFLSIAVPFESTLASTSCDVTATSANCDYFYSTSTSASTLSIFDFMNLMIIFYLMGGVTFYVIKELT